MAGGRAAAVAACVCVCSLASASALVPAFVSAALAGRRSLSAAAAGRRSAGWLRSKGLDDLDFDDLQRMEEEMLRSKGLVDAAGGRDPATTAAAAAAAAAATCLDGAIGDPDAAIRRGECASYRWTQEDDCFLIEVPLPRAVGRSEVNLAVSPTTFQLGVRGTPELEPISGTFYGEVDPTHISYEVVRRAGEDPAVEVRLPKESPEGTYEMWAGLLQGDAASPTVRFRRQVERYTWSQVQPSPLAASARLGCHPPPPPPPPSSKPPPCTTRPQGKGSFTVQIRVPPGTSKRDVALEFTPDGSGLSLSFDSDPDFGQFQGDFWGRIAQADSAWFLEPGPRGEPATFELVLAKKDPPSSSQGGCWWPGLMREEAAAL